MGKRKSKKGRSARNASSTANVEPEELSKAPHSFVIHRGTLGKNGTQLMLNFRKMLEPFTASKLKVTKQNVLKDFVSMAGPLNVTQIVAFTKSEISMYIKLIRLPRGPTLTFRILEYSLAKDVVSSLKKAVVYEDLFSHHPLLVLNNFTGEGMHLKLMTTMFQGLFPSININKTNLNSIRRCLLVNYNSEKTVELRHFAIRIRPTGLSKPVKKLIGNKVPDLSSLADVSEFMDGADLSESEAELDGPLNEVVLPQAITSRGNMSSQKSAIRLHELGPRLKLQLIKIEDGIATGDVLYHEFIKRTPEEIKALKLRRLAKEKMKAKRRKTQAENVAKKEKAKRDLEEQDSSQRNEHNGDVDDDEKWYTEEVGHKPRGADFIPNKRKRLNTDGSGGKISKKVRFDEKTRNSKEKPEKKEQNFQTHLEKRKKKKLAKLRKRRRMSKGKKK